MDELRAEDFPLWSMEQVEMVEGRIAALTTMLGFGDDTRSMLRQLVSSAYTNRGASAAEAVAMVESACTAEAMAAASALSARLRSSVSEFNATLRRQRFYDRLPWAVLYTMAMWPLLLTKSGHYGPPWYQDTMLQIGEPILRAARRLTRG